MGSVDYRFRGWIKKNLFKIPLLGILLYVFYKSIFSNIIYAFSGIEVHDDADIGAGLQIYHGNGIVVHPRVKIGKNFALWQQVKVETFKSGSILF